MVNEEDIRDLFSDCGTLEKCCINYDNAGRSRGTAEVFFARKKDALTAISKYAHVPLDGLDFYLFLKVDH
ncbi:hypothetical protein MXB_2885 [Myxobolus squamalis]|nr:hypothetical protein MXB_2885 [Myxobolus squamalis]